MSTHLHWRLVASETREHHRLLTMAARVDDGTGAKAWVWKNEWWQIPTMDGEMRTLVKERFGLSREGCMIHTLDNLLAALMAVAA